jgi:FkbM family methyltransferase
MPVTPSTLPVQPSSTIPRRPKGNDLIRQCAQRLHAALARGPRWLAYSYLCLLSAVSRNLLPFPLAQRAYNSVCLQGIVWPEMRFAPRRVRLGAKVEMMLTPHLEEFDAEALFFRGLTYERPVFAWLADNVPGTYDLVIEIGANVGVFTIFLDALCQQAKAQPSSAPRIVAFEPSQGAFARLLENVAANDMRFSSIFQAAIGPTSKLQTFFEPKGHLTNGSFLREFSEIFSDRIEENVAVMVSAMELERWLKPARRALIKIDVEGFEPDLVTALKPLLDRYRPDVLIEVVPFTVDELERSPALAGYGRYLIADSGLEQAPALFASHTHRDWLLRWPST